MVGHPKVVNQLPQGAREIDRIDIDLSMTSALFRLKRRVELYLIDLVLLGCVADPIIYAARMRQVRFGYARVWNYLVRRVACHVQGPPTSSARGRSSSNEARLS